LLAVKTTRKSDVKNPPKTPTPINAIIAVIPSRIPDARTKIIPRTVNIRLHQAKKRITFEMKRIAGYLVLSDI